MSNASYPIKVKLFEWLEQIKSFSFTSKIISSGCMFPVQADGSEVQQSAIHRSDNELIPQVCILHI